MGTTKNRIFTRGCCRAILPKAFDWVCWMRETCHQDTMPYFSVTGDKWSFSLADKVGQIKTFDSFIGHFGKVALKISNWTYVMVNNINIPQQILQVCFALVWHQSWFQVKKGESKCYIISSKRSSIWFEDLEDILEEPFLNGAFLSVLPSGVLKRKTNLKKGFAQSASKAIFRARTYDSITYSVQWWWLLDEWN